MANKGTLFLDEIGDLSLKLQAKLLKNLENLILKPLPVFFLMSILRL